MTRRHHRSQAWLPASQLQDAGRNVSRLLSDFGHRLPAAPQGMTSKSRSGYDASRSALSRTACAGSSKRTTLRNETASAP
jgi:hypothetical protein